MSILDSRADSSSSSRLAPWLDPGLAAGDHRTGIDGREAFAPAAPPSSSSPMADGEYVCIGIAQQRKANEAPIAPPAPNAGTAAAPSTGRDQPGSAFGGNRLNRPPQMLWTDAGLAAGVDAGRRQGGLGDAQSRTNLALAAAVVGASPDGGIGNAPQPLSPADVAALVQASGIPSANQDPAQLVSAARYINRAANPADLQARIARALDGFHILRIIGPPRLDALEMKELLWNAARVPGHAFGSMGEAEIAARYQDVAAALNLGGRQEVRIGKHVLKMSIDANGQVAETSTKKPGWFKSFLKGALTVASFIPVTAPFAAIANAAWSAYEGIRNGNWLQAIAGAGGALASGVTAFAGNLAGGAAATTARIADTVAKGATAAQAGFDAARGRGAMGMFNGIVGAVSSGAGAIANGAGKVAEVAREVQQWARRAGDGVSAANSFRQGDIGAGIGQSATLASTIAGDFRNEDGSLAPGAAGVRKIAIHAAEGGRMVGAIEQRRYGQAVADGWNLFRNVFSGDRDRGGSGAGLRPSGLGIANPDTQASRPGPAWMQTVDRFLRIFSGDRNAVPSPRPPYILH